MIFGDTRYFKFPTQTYGLGDQTTLADVLPIDYFYLRLYQIVFREIMANVFIGFGYNLDYHWNVEKDDIPGKTWDEFNTFQKGTCSVSSGVSLNFRYDKWPFGRCCVW